MSTHNPKELSEPDFERSLLDSARADPLPQNVQIAWANFAGAMRLAASHVEPGSGLHTIEHPEKTVSRGGGEITQGVRAGLGKAATWLIVGAIGGSALTARLLVSPTGGTPSDPARAAAQLVPAVSAPSKGNSASLSTAMAPTALVVASDAGNGRVAPAVGVAYQDSAAVARSQLAGAGRCGSSGLDASLN